MTKSKKNEIIEYDYMNAFEININENDVVFNAKYGKKTKKFNDTNYQ